MVVDPDQAGTLCGHTFARYAASGVEVALACASSTGWEPRRVQAVRRLGVHDVVLLDYPKRELSSPDLERALADVMTGMRPHVVVVERQEALAGVATAAFKLARRGGGSKGLPAKLYLRASLGSPIPVTTRVGVTGHPAEHFVRIHPSPWVTGVLETDLFAGIRDLADEAPEQLLAS
jgi:hypothetical protein